MAHASHVVLGQRPTQEVSDAFDSLVRHAKKLGLSGVMIVAPTCEKCGQCHDFLVASNLVAGAAELCREVADDLDTNGTLTHVLVTKGN